MTIENKLLAAERLLLDAQRCIQKAAVLLTHAKGQTLESKGEYIKEPECEE